MDFASWFELMSRNRLEWPTLRLAQVGHATEVRLVVSEALLSVGALTNGARALLEKRFARQRPFWAYFCFAADYYFTHRYYVPRHVQLEASEPDA